jgi:hypothetical protein
MMIQGELRRGDFILSSRVIGDLIYRVVSYSQFLLSMLSSTPTVTRIRQGMLGATTTENTLRGMCYRVSMQWNAAGIHRVERV